MYCSSCLDWRTQSKACAKQGRHCQHFLDDSRQRIRSAGKELPVYEYRVKSVFTHSKKTELTENQIQIMRLLSLHMRVSEIARIRNKSTPCVFTTIALICRKLGVISKEEAVAKWMEMEEALDMSAVPAV